MARASWLVVVGGVSTAAALLLAACASLSGDAPDAAAQLARGGRLYDNWMTETGAPTPDADHPLYPADAAYAGQPGATWRCKECHGWDYLGRDGAYAEGNHATGIVGIAGYSGRSVADVEAVLRDASHDYGNRMTDADLHAIARFVSEGQVAMDVLIDRASKSVRADAARGAAYYATLCASCHGPSGKAEDMPTLGAVSRKNPWETLHKILNGQPNTAMPALRALDRGVALDVLDHLQTLPE